MFACEGHPIVYVLFTKSAMNSFHAWILLFVCVDMADKYATMVILTLDEYNALMNKKEEETDSFAEKVLDIPTETGELITKVTDLPASDVINSWPRPKSLAKSIAVAG